MTKVYAYKWMVGIENLDDPDALGMREVIIPDEANDPRDMFIECALGAKSGRACLYFRQTDAIDLIDSTEELTIRCSVLSREDDAEVFSTDQTIEWKGYLACEISEVDELGNVWLTLRDKRVKLERAGIDRVFNQVFLLAVDGADNPYTFYDERYCKASNVPYSNTEIVEEIFGATDLTVPTLSASPTETPANIHCKGSCAEVLDAFLATLGCTLKFDPFSNALSIVSLSASYSLATLTTAESEGRLIEKVEIELEEKDKHGGAIIWPAEHFPIRSVESDTGTFGSGKKYVVIRDHEIADETSKTVKAARKTVILQAVEDWFKAESELFDETYYGMIAIAPGSTMREVTWWLSNHETGHATQCKNYSPPFPWINRKEFELQACIVGETTDTGLLNSDIAKVKYFVSIDGGSYVDSGYFVYAIAYPDSITANTRVAMWPTEFKWVATLSTSSVSDTLERFLMTSNWYGGICTATFTNLSEPAFPVIAGILEDPEGIFTDILTAGNRGLAIRTRYNRHYIIQAKCNQTPAPSDPTGACEAYIEELGTICIVTTLDACTELGGDYAGNGTTC
ncbi:hypothetical protein VN12_04420 [Pirellula sp. SH-Sr6A]|uniref:hypothetical protein n=1 Tax=Pirellula sp. SH-Sr6A TaxID=1632865 RepID=UPI00078C0CAD|nr:hypothetical protein [Pirellula sp. SH-Sr6A]AMV31338.1 hypothetical protein VN12_04420 [Pirellula sp. SH-Sr6A]